MALTFITTVNRPSTPSLTAFLEGVLANPDKIARFEIAPQFQSEVLLPPLKLGCNLFVQRENLDIAEYGHGPFETRHTELVAIPSGRIMARSLAIIAPGDYVYEGSLDWSLPREQRLASIAAFDPSIRVTARNGAELSNVMREETSDQIAVPICGPGMPNFGHFLYDGLSMALVIRNNPAFTDRIVFAGPPLKAWQNIILQKLNILDHYRPLPENVLFRNVIAHTMLYGHLSFPSRFLRPVFDILRMQVSPSDQKVCGRVFLSRGDDRKRYLINREDMEEAFRSKGFRILDPTKEGLQSTIFALANCSYVIGESGAGMANVGFCNIGTKVLEIQPSNFPERYTRQTCAVFGMKWHVYIAETLGPKEASTYHVKGARSCFVVDITKLMAAVDSIETTV